MPQSKFSILIVEDDSRVSRVLHHHLEKAFPNVRVEIAGSAARAKQICEKFPPTILIWDGAPDEHGKQEEYFACVPNDLWKRVIPISPDPSILETAQQRGAQPPLPKKNGAVNTWSEEIVHRLRPLLLRK
ncbi:MAG: hypothetical protein V1746_03630 [bacterium]